MRTAWGPLRTREKCPRPTRCPSSDDVSANALAKACLPCRFAAHGKRQTSAAPSHCMRRRFLPSWRRQPFTETVIISRLRPCLAATLLFACSAHGAEICRFAGHTDYSGQLTLTAIDRHAADGTITVDVLGAFRGTPWPFVHVRYLEEELSRWRSGQLQSVAVNTRYLVDGHIVRQLWDDYTADGHGLTAYRLEGSPTQIQQKHPGFIRHWDPATFGEPWLQDFRSAHPDRRPDLDLPVSSMRPGLRVPLALAFYWSRWPPPGAQTVDVFLPGFKEDKTADLTVQPAGPQGDGWHQWQIMVRYPGLSISDPSTATAQISTDGHLLQLAGRMITRNRLARGEIHQEGCTGR